MNISLFIGDVFRWLIGAFITYLVVLYGVIGLLYFFEFCVLNLVESNLLVYIIVWIIIFGIAIPIITAIFSILIRLSTYLIRQHNIFASIASGLFFIGLLVLLILFWTNYLSFSWEELPYANLNRWIFSSYLFSLMSIPMIVGSSIKDSY